MRPGFRDREKVPRGADTLQGCLASARQWAKRDRVPTGVRLISYNGPNPAYSSTCVELQYIQQPPNYTLLLGTGATCPITVTSGTTVTLAGSPISDFSGGLSPTTPGVWPVQALDYIVLQGTIHQIAAVSATSLTLGARAGNATGTTDYYIVRAPRALAGEASVKMPQDVVIDFRAIPGSPGTQRSTLPATNNGNYDLVFNPSGELLTPPGTNGSNMYFFWVCDNSKLNATTTINDDTLIAVNGRTGQVAAHPVNQTGDPYSFCKDGRSSGM